MADDEPTVHTIEGFAELRAGLESIPTLAKPLLHRAMTLSLDAIIGRVRPYPPETAANRPGRISEQTGRPMGYYERNRGWWYPVMLEKTLGQRKRTKTRNVIQVRKDQSAYTPIGYKLAKNKRGKPGTSEQLSKGWIAKVQEVPLGTEGTIGNNASYHDAVQGNKQARLHADNGWKTLDTAIAEAKPDITQAFTDASKDLVIQVGGRHA